MPHSVHRPGVFDDEESDPREIADVDEIDAACYEGHGVDDKKSDIEDLLMPRYVLVIGDVIQEFLYGHSEINYATTSPSPLIGFSSFIYGYSTPTIDGRYELGMVRCWKHHYGILHQNL